MIGLTSLTEWKRAIFSLTKKVSGTQMRLELYSDYQNVDNFLYSDYRDVDKSFYSDVLRLSRRWSLLVIRCTQLLITSGKLRFTKIFSGYRDVYNFLLSSDLMYSDPTTSWLIPKSTGSNESLGSVQNWRKYMSNVKSMSLNIKHHVKSQNLDSNQNKISLTIKIKPSRRGRRWRGYTRWRRQSLECRHSSVSPDRWGKWNQ